MQNSQVKIDLSFKKDLNEANAPGAVDEDEMPTIVRKL